MVGVQCSGQLCEEQRAKRQKESTMQDLVKCAPLQSEPPQVVQTCAIRLEPLRQIVQVALVTGTTTSASSDAR
jgi:hypothetical protein